MSDVAEVIEPRAQAAKAESMIEFPLGLLGFEQVKRYFLLADPEEEPFMRLQMAERPNQAFLVVQPRAVVEDYQPDLAPEDVQFLGLRQAEDALVLNIVTVRQDGRATVNLKGPIVLNRHTRIGKQVIPLNATSLAVQYPIGCTEVPDEATSGLEPTQHPAGAAGPAARTSIASA